MYDYGYGFVGMHFVWWVFWILAVVLFFSFLTPVPRRRADVYRLTPLQILQRRYAAGDITSEEYEERKAKLERDAGKS
jgi:putative membrane protein